MASSAIDIVSVADAKKQLRIDEDSSDNDEIVRETIESAVDFIDNALIVPLIDVTFDIELPYPKDKESPVFFNRDFITTVTSVKYWSNGANGSSSPDQVVETADLGRVVKRQNEKFKETFISAVYPPSTGWVEWNVGEWTPFQASVALGITTVPRTIRQAIIAIMRRMYDGYWETDSMRGSPDYRNLIAGYESWLL